MAHRGQIGGQGAIGQIVFGRGHGPVGQPRDPRMQPRQHRLPGGLAQGRYELLGDFRVQGQESAGRGLADGLADGKANILKGR